MTRVPVAALALSRGGGFTLAERVFMAASWVPKVPGTEVQGCLWALQFGVHGGVWVPMFLKLRLRFDLSALHFGDYGGSWAP